MERQTSLVNFKYVVHKLNIPISEANETWLAYLPELTEYRDRYYGTTLHFPLVLIESIYHFTLEPSQFYGMRHFYTFLNYYLGVICSFLLLSRRFGSKKYGLAGMLMMILTPRFFAESFYNNKDVIFTAWYVICAFAMDRWFRNTNLTRTILLAFAIALTCNTRFNGIIFIAIFIFLVIIDSLRNHRLDKMKYAAIMMILTVIFFYLITPNFWEHPISTLIETLQFNMRHPNHGSDGNLFNGKLVDAARTWSYIPVWILLTVPTTYLLFTLIGSECFIRDMFKQLRSKSYQDIELTDLMMFISGFGAAVFIVITHVTIYNSWRHCYFAFPCIVFFAVYGLSKTTTPKLRIVAMALLSLTFFYNAFWIYLNHPYEYVYFAPLVRSNARNYSGDYWGISSRALLEYITESDPQRMLRINHAYTQAGSINRGLLPEEERIYLELTYDDDDVDYYIVCRDDKPDTIIGKNGYEKVYAIKVDEDEIGAVYKKVEK